MLNKDDISKEEKKNEKLKKKFRHLWFCNGRPRGFVDLNSNSNFKLKKRNFNSSNKMIKFGSSTLLRSLFVNYTKTPASTTINKSGLFTEPVRYTGFFNRLTGEQLWKGVTSVSNAGKKKGRGRRGDKMASRNLNIGQRVGVGKIRVLWPGLNTPIIKNRELQSIRQSNDSASPEDTEAPPPPIKRKQMTKIHPLDRGWSGRQSGGRRIGPPDPIHDETFEGFESIVLKHRLASRMSSTLGRKRTFSSIVATGNRNGLIGVGRAQSVDAKVALSLAKSRASKRLLSVNFIDKNTVNHDFVSEYGRTRVFVFKKPEGSGLRCHRIITALCQLVGIKDLHAKVEGAMNPIHIIRAFILGLLRQKTYQEIADENKLHLVEFRSDMDGFPRVVASPEKCLTVREAREKPILFEEYIFGGRLRQVYDKKIPFYQRLPSWTIHLKKVTYERNHELVRLNLLSEYGSYKSHLTRVYPECVSRGIQKPKEKE